MSATRPEILALIPARGGSKGIPRKNLLPLAGKPLIAYSIEQARASRWITRVVVSTDDQEIAEVARGLGADVPFRRPAEFAADDSTDLDVFQHALGWLREHEGRVPEMVVHLRPTGPVRRVAVIDDAIERMLARPDAESLRSICAPAQTPFKMWRITGGYLEPVAPIPGWPEAHSAPRQRLPAVYWQNGYVDIVRPAAVLDRASMTGSRILPFVVDDPVLELDYPDDVPAVERALAALSRGEALVGHGPTRHPV